MAMIIKKTSPAQHRRRKACLACCKLVISDHETYWLGGSGAWQQRLVQRDVGEPCVGWTNVWAWGSPAEGLPYEDQWRLISLFHPCNTKLYIQYVIVILRVKVRVKAYSKIRLCCSSHLRFLHLWACGGILHLKGHKTVAAGLPRHATFPGAYTLYQDEPCVVSPAWIWSLTRGRTRKLLQHTHDNNGNEGTISSSTPPCLSITVAFRLL